MSKNHPLIMVVEDEELLRQAIVKKLASEEMAPLPFANGKEGIIYLQSTQHLPDLIWLDYYLKDMNGLEFMTELKKDIRLSQIPVVVVSNSANPKKVNQLLSSGVQRYLLKAENRLEDIVKVILQLLKQEDGNKQI